MKFHFFQKKLFIFAVVMCVILLAGSIVLYALVGPFMSSKGSNYSIPQIDLSQKPTSITSTEYDELFNLVALDTESDYMAHPDSVLLNKGTDAEKILTIFVDGHGKGKLITRTSEDGGNSYSPRLTTTPTSWEKSEETPTVYELKKSDGQLWHVMISANPKWPGYATGDGFNASISKDNCATWTEFKKFYGKNDPVKHVSPIVAMSSLVQLKENGVYVDKWMGIFHDHNFKNYKTILTFDKNGEMQWSKPVEYFKGEKGNYFDIAKGTQMCEVQMFRSPDEKELCLITRSNTKRYNSLVSFSTDEGQTWSEPREAAAALNGERHKVVKLEDGKLAITFRSIERDKAKLKKNYNGSKNWYSEGWIMWVGTYDDIKAYYNGDKTKEGSYRIKIAHTYLQGTKGINISANADTGYCGNVLLKDGTIVTSTYGCFSDSDINSAGEYRTYIASKRINLAKVEKLMEELKLK